MKETTNLKLKKPDLNDFYNVDDFNYNSDIIDRSIKEVQDTAESKAPKDHTHDASDINGISTNAKGTSFDNSTNGMAATNVQDAIEENKTSILELEKTDGKLANLQTDNKTNLVAAINEVFQNANNGKDIIANAIGSPLVNSDTFSSMGTKIDTLTQTFQNTLTYKGVEVLPGDKMSTLIDKVGGIELGKKWASGIRTGEINSKLSIRGLAFRPSMIGAYNSKLYPNTSYYSFYSKKIVENFPEYSDKAVVVSTGQIPQFYNSVTIYEDGFDINLSRTDGDVYWIAYE